MTPLPAPLRGVPAPAKLNLFLHVTGRRDDGYHLLQSVFVLLDWCDTLDFEVRADGLIERRDVGPLALPAEDLCVKAARALQQATACPWGATITLHKQLPAEAGLGGGSSDAATCLLALNRLWGLGLTRAELAAIGARLGADVPFFVQGRNAWVEGIGEDIRPLALRPQPCVVLKPLAGVSTQAIFSDPALRRDTPRVRMRDFAANAPPLPALSFMQGTHNDLQAVAQRLCPDIQAALIWLERQGLSARMTGSGAAVFALADERCVLETAPPGWQLKICSILEVHPVFDWCTG